MTDPKGATGILPLRFDLAMAATVLFTLAIAVGALTPMPQLPGPEGSDKSLHFLAFAVLVLPLTLAGPRHLFWAAPAALAYGALIEVVQPYVGRSRELADLMADGLGILVGAVVGALLYVLLARRAR